MKNETIKKMFEESVNKAITKVSYTQGDHAGILLKEIFKGYLGLTTVKELWGPIWVLPLTIIAGRVSVIIGHEIDSKSIKSVICEMVGYSDVTPSSLIPKGVDLTLPEICMSNDTNNEQVKNYLATTIQISVKLDIPSPIEIAYLYAKLGEKACPIEVYRLWMSNPKEYKLDHTSLSDCNTMINSTAVLYHGLSDPECITIGKGDTKQSHTHVKDIYRDAIARVVEDRSQEAVKEKVASRAKAVREQTEEVLYPSMKAEIVEIKSDIRILQGKLDTIEAKLDTALEQLELFGSLL